MAQKKDSLEPTLLDGEKKNSVEVLYQKMGDRWFAFSMIDDELFIGSVTQEEIDSKNANTPSNS